MAQLPGRRTPHLILAALLLLVAPAADAQVDLEGTWHVLVHYTDDNTSHPDQQRWLDRVWVFERKGSRLQWIEYPIAVFDDESGRFERRGTGQYARTLGAWEPSPEQLQNIREGVRVNTRGMKRKSLRGSDDGGWRTVSRARAGSASVITYQENWSVEGMPKLPVFVQQDVMGSVRSESLEGETRYETASVEEGGGLLLGRFERDGTRHGSFQMRRAGQVGMLEEKTQAEIQAQALRRGMASSRLVRDALREEIARGLAENGVSLPDQQIDAVVDQVVSLYAEGVQGPELREKFAERMARLSGGDAVREPIKQALAANGVVLSDEEIDLLSGEAMALYVEGVRGPQLLEELKKRVEELTAARGE
jgi:hypothetical protein